MADTAIAPTNEKVVFKGKPQKEAAAPGADGVAPKAAAKVKPKPKDGEALKRAKKLLSTGAISQKQHDKMVGTFAPAPAGAGAEIAMSDDD
jgi:hypothetical protein